MKDPGHRSDSDRTHGAMGEVSTLESEAEKGSLTAGGVRCGWCRASHRHVTGRNVRPPHLQRDRGNSRRLTEWQDHASIHGTALSLPSTSDYRPMPRGSPSAPAEKRLVARAWLQHRLVERVRLAIDEESGGLAAFAQAVGIPARTIQDKLEGWTPAVFEDLVSWPMQLDLSKYPSIKFGQALLPLTELIRNDHEADVVALPRRSKRGS